MTERETDRESSSTGRQRSGRPVQILCLLLFTLLSCSEGIPSDLQVSNYAGAGRAWYWSNVNLPAFDYFQEVEIESLDVGLLGPPLSLGTHDMVALAAGGRLVRIRNNQALWSSEIAAGESFMPELASDARGQIYIQSVDAELFAVDTGGRPLWRSTSVLVDEGRFGLPLFPLALEDRVIVGNTDGLLAAVDSTGGELWKLSFPTKLTRSLARVHSFDLQENTGFAIGQTHNRAGDEDTVRVVDYLGGTAWKRGVGGRIEVGPVSGDRSIFVGVSSSTADGKYRPELIALEPNDGKVLWRSPLRVLPRHIALDGDGNTYVTGGGGGALTGGVIASFDPVGKKRWEIGLRQSVPSTIMVAGNVFFIARQGRSIGLFSYTREGNFLKYTPVETPLRLSLPPTLLPTGKLIIAVRDSPLLLRN